MASSVIIRKKSDYTWEHFYDNRPVYVTNIFNINNGGNETFNIVEYRGAKLDSVPIANVTLFDDTLGGSAETFATFSQLNTRLGELNYPAINSVASGDSVDSYKKQYLSETIIEEANLIYDLPTNGSTNFLIPSTATIFSIQGFNIPSGYQHLFVGKLFIISNQSNNDIYIEVKGQNSPPADIEFNPLQGVANYIKSNQTVTFKYSTRGLEFTNPTFEDLEYKIQNVIESEILEKGLIWQMPNIDGSYSTGSGSQYLRLGNSPAIQNSVTDNFFGLSCGVFQTTSTAGTIAGIRRNDGINLQTFNNVIFERDFTVDSNISNDCRYIVGVSKNYQFAFPTNNDPSVHTECIYVAKLATSNNLHIVHNDNAGTATTINLGVNFPANSNLYKYRFSLSKISESNYSVKITRKTLSSGVVLESSTYNLTTDLPTSGGVLQQILAITNNATAINMRLGDYGLILKRL